MPPQEKKPSRAEYENEIGIRDKRIEMLEDRMAILMVVLKQRHGDWDPWFREGAYQDPESLGDEIRSWPEYRTGREIITFMTRKLENGLGTD